MHDLITQCISKNPLQLISSCDGKVNGDVIGLIFILHAPLELLKGIEGEIHPSRTSHLQENLYVL